MRHARLLFAFTLLVLFCATVRADPSASILGRVSDPSGASVSNAAISVRNEATGIERTTMSTGTGDFEVTLLPITGKYTLTVSSQGFEKQQISGIELQV